MINVNEVKELKSRFTLQQCSITRFYGAYVDKNKEIVTKFFKKFMDEEEAEFKKYLELIQSIFSTKIENNLLTLEFASEGGMKETLWNMADTGLKEEAAVDMLIERVIERYDYPGNFLILVFSDIYDILKRAADGTLLDESEDTYKYITCLICPVDLEKPGLQYDSKNNAISKIDRDWIVGKPRVGFVYPAFEDRQPDRDHILYYTADCKDTKPEVMELLECDRIFSMAEIQSIFEHMVFDATQDPDLTDDYMMRISAELEYSEQKKDCILTVSELKDVMEGCNIPENYIGMILKAYSKRWSASWPKAHWLYNSKLAKQYHAEVKKQKGRFLLDMAAKELLSRGHSDTAEEINRYLESTR